MIKLLIGGSPCTHWSIAQKNNRETKAEGVGWELFKNYLIAKEKFKPDFFLYENNKSAAQAIKDQIFTELSREGQDDNVRLTYINSALVSAQNRQRFYVTNFGDIEQPEDRGILLKDILEREHDLCSNEKSYCLTARYNGAVPWNTIERSQRTMVAEPINDIDGKARTIKAQYHKTSIANTTYSASYGATMCAIPIRIGQIENELKNQSHDSKQYRVYSPDGKATTLCGNGGGVGAKTGLYAVPIDKDAPVYPIYEVKNGIITIREKQYPIKLADGYYIIRKLTVTECCRLQTLPDDYCKAVSNSQGYKGLGNGWTADVIIHLLNHALKDVPRDDKIIVLSMYDGIGTGRYCLDTMGFTNVEYHAYEIDKYAMTVANDNFPDIIQHGDAFAVRSDDWKVE